MNKSKQKSRRSIRLKDLDYSNPGYYYVTICTYNRGCILGDIENGEMVLNDLGKIVDNVWKSLSDRFPVELDTFQIMPNHLHLTICIFNSRRGLINQTLRMNQRRTQFNKWMDMINHAPTLGNIIRHFKGKSSRLSGQKLWQRNYYEHVIRNESDLKKIRTYIKNNPRMWDDDKDNPKNITWHSG